jgi:hypothetical protein
LQEQRPAVPIHKITSKQKALGKMTITSDRTAARAIQNAQYRFPTISADGTFIAIRGAPFQKIVREQVSTATEFLSMLAATETGRVDSYRLKHVAEDWGRHHEMCEYVSNGALIVAALALELAVTPCGPSWSTSPNCMIGVSEKSVRRMIVTNALIRRERG